MARSRSKMFSQSLSIADLISPQLPFQLHAVDSRVLYYDGAVTLPSNTLPHTLSEMHQEYPFLEHLQRA